ncbi:YdcF family protein [Nocardia tengchongensis]
MERLIRDQLLGRWMERHQGADAGELDGAEHQFTGPHNAIGLGVPPEAILVEPRATNTGDNIDFSHALLDEHGLLDSISSVMLISRPYQQRRSYAICRKRWPGVDVTCGSLPLALDDYVASIGDIERVMNMLVGDTQRVWVYPAKGWAIEQNVPAEVMAAYDRLVDAGFTRRLLAEG